MKKKTLTLPETQLLVKPDTSPIIPQRSKLKSVLKIYQRELTDKQKQFLTLAADKTAKVIFVSGPAGTSKTFLAVYHALTMINEKRVSDLVYVRTTVECSDKSMGFLPGVISDKLSPYLQPLMDKLEELLPKNEIELLQKENRITGVPIGFLRGLNWNAKVIVLDEAQNCTFKELFTLITRIGQFSKVFIIGDPGQSDINGKSGFTKMLNCFNDTESQLNGIYTFHFTEDDVVRSELVKFITKKLRGQS